MHTAPRVPVILLTGFLGAGKTTLLNRLLAGGLHGECLAAIVNDIGAIGIDGRTVRAGALTVREVASGCICCSAGDEFGATLDAVLTEVQPVAIVVETSGVANPSVLLTVLQDERLRLETVVTVLDAATFARARRYARVVEWQVAFADLVLLNKADLADAATLAAAETLVHEINPRAAIVRAVRGALDPDLLVGTLASDRRARWMAASPDLARVAHSHDGEPDRGHLATDDIATVAWQTERPLRRAALETALQDLALHGVFRAKGLVTLAGTDERALVNYVAGRYEIEEREAAAGPSQLVCIGKGRELDRAAIARGWVACVAPVVPFPGTIGEGGEAGSAQLRPGAGAG